MSDLTWAAVALDWLEVEEEATGWEGGGGGGAGARFDEEEGPVSWGRIDEGSVEWRGSDSASGGGDGRSAGGRRE